MHSLKIAFLSIIICHSGLTNMPAKAMRTNQQQTNDVSTKFKKHNRIDGKNIWLISYADGDTYYFRNQAILSASAALNGVDVIKQYNISHIDNNFLLKNKDIFNIKKGAGVWLWKPYFIYKTLNEMPEGDILVYADTSIKLIAPVTKIVQDMLNLKEEITLFYSPTLWFGVKRDVLRHMGMDNIKWREEKSLEAGVLIAINSRSTRSFFKEWLELSQKPGFLADEPHSKGEYPKLRHCHDQGLLTALYLKYRGTKKYKFMPRNYLADVGFFPKDIDGRPFCLVYAKDMKISIPLDNNWCNIQKTNHDEIKYYSDRSYEIGSKYKPE